MLFYSEKRVRPGRAGVQCACTHIHVHVPVHVWNRTHNKYMYTCIHMTTLRGPVSARCGCSLPGSDSHFLRGCGTHKKDKKTLSVLALSINLNNKEKTQKGPLKQTESMCSQAVQYREESSRPTTI